MRIHSLALLLFFQSLLACQQSPENARPLAVANSSLSTTATSQSDSQQVRPAAVNIIFQSTNGGQTWQDVSAGLPADVQPNGVFTSGGEVFLGAEKGLYRSSSSAFAAPVWEQEILMPGRISEVSSGRAGWYACSYGFGIFQKLPGTPIWENISLTLSDKTVRTVLETPDGAILVGTDSGIFKSADGGQSWKQVFNKGIVLNLVASGDVLIGGSRQGVLRSTDGGEHWENVLNENILAKKIGFIGNRLVTILGTEDPSQVPPEGVTHRLRASSDGGQTWQRLEQALGPMGSSYAVDERLAQTKDIYDIVQAGEFLFCSFDTGIFRSADQGKTWELVFPFSKNKQAFRLGVSGGVVYAILGGGC